MVDLNADYEVMAYSVGDTKAGTKIGKLQLRNIEENTVWAIQKPAQKWVSFN